jgi:hypothetical protein
MVFCGRDAPDGASVFSQGSGRRASDARSPWLRWITTGSPWQGDRRVAFEIAIRFAELLSPSQGSLALWSAAFGVPSGTSENSPAIHRWVTKLRFSRSESRQGRLMWIA